MMILSPSYRIHAERITTYCQAKLPTVRHAPNRSIDLHPTTAYLHPRVSAYLHPTTAYMHPTSAYMHPKVSIYIHPTSAYFAPNPSAYMHPKSAYMHPRVSAYMHQICDLLKICFMVWDLSRSVPMVFRTPGNPLINLFHFICNSKCHFFKVSFFI